MWNTKPTDIYFVLPQQLHLMDLAGPAQIFTELGEPRLHYVSNHQRLISAQGLAFEQLKPLPERLPENAWVILIGAKSLECDLKNGYTPYAVWLQQVFRTDLLIITICSGAFIAAAAGLLGERMCTTHHSLVSRLQTLAPDAKVLENRIFVGADRLWSSAGISTGIDLVLHLVAKYWGQQKACAIARELVVYQRRSGHEPQLSIFLNYRNHVHDKIHRVQDLLTENPAKQWRLDEMAATAYVSKRHLTRIFSQHTGVSIGRYLLQLRLALAQLLLQQSSFSIEQVAEQSGFGSARQFRRLWQREKCCSPQDWRSHYATVEKSRPQS